MQKYFLKFNFAKHILLKHNHNIYFDIGKYFVIINKQTNMYWLKLSWINTLFICFSDASMF